MVALLVLLSAIAAPQPSSARNIQERFISTPPDHATDVVQGRESAGDRAVDSAGDTAAAAVTGCCACTQANATAVVAQTWKIAARHNGASDAGAAADPGDIAIVQFKTGCTQDLAGRIGIGGSGVRVGAGGTAIHVTLHLALDHNHTITRSEHWKAHAGTQYAADQEEAQ